MLLRFLKTYIINIWNMLLFCMPGGGVKVLDIYQKIYFLWNPSEALNFSFSSQWQWRIWPFPRATKQNEDIAHWEKANATWFDGFCTTIDCSSRVQFHQIQVSGYDTTSWKIWPMGCQIGCDATPIWYSIGQIFHDFASYPRKSSLNLVKPDSGYSPQIDKKSQNFVWNDTKSFTILVTTEN